MKDFYKIIRNSRGFSIVEVVVAAIIFAIAAAGMYATVASLNKPAEDFSERSKAAMIGKQVLEMLRFNVDQDYWETETANPTYPLSFGQHNMTAVVLDGVIYSSYYIVTQDPDTGGRKVSVNVYWPD